MEQEIKVSVFCLVYNHEKFLEKCLEGFVNQKTNFKYEILIHDDVSSDNSREIIEKYYERYPDIIVPIFADENRYSKHIPIINTILMPKAKGKYFAFCEGDDYWCDMNKLQKQYDYMEQHPECTICLHNTRRHDLTGQNKDELFNDWKTIHELTQKEIFMGWNVHTSSFFIRRDAAILPKFCWKYWHGDYVRLTMAYNKGKAVALPDVMSVYNANNSNGVLHYKNTKDSANKDISEIEYLNEYNEFTNKKYNDIVLERINNIKMRKYYNIYKLVDSYKDYKEFRKEMFQDDFCKEYFKSINWIHKIIFNLTYKNYVTFKLIKILKNEYGGLCNKIFQKLVK